MRYALLAFEDQATIEARTPEEQEDLLAAYGAVAQALAEQGKLVFGDGLASPTMATSLRSVDHKPLVTDGPMVESREHLIGVFVIDAEDLDEALGWASRMPHAKSLGGVEIRPVGG